jgi:hypothetical protein
MSFAVELAERRLLPDRWVRAGIRNLLRTACRRRQCATISPPRGLGG